MAKHAAEKRPAFLNLFAGGIGTSAARYFRQLYEADGRRFTTLLVQIDTDPTRDPAVDRSIFIPLDGGKVGTLQADPASFGPVAATIVREYPQYLNPEDVVNGARTIRMLTQLAFEYHYDSILRQLRDCLLELRHQGGFDTVIPVTVSSSGGGTGSAWQVLFPWALQDRSFRGRLCEGLGEGFLQTPIAFVVEPFAHARRHQETHADKVLGNAFALRDESAELEKGSAYKYLIHLGLANDGGTVLDSPEEVAMVLGTSCYQVECHWSLIKARLVDTVDSDFEGYTGNDVPERVQPWAWARRPAPATSHRHAPAAGQPSTNGQPIESLVSEGGA